MSGAGAGRITGPTGADRVERAGLAGPEPIRIGVLGCADIARRRLFPALAASPDFELAAIASRDVARAAECAAQFGGVPVGGYAALLERDDIDAVYVPVPTGLHHEWVGRALRSGKHTLAEKPLATTLPLARDLLTQAAERGLALCENFMFLHHGQHAAVRSLVASGAIGVPREFRAVFAIPPRPPQDVRYRADLGGGTLLDNGVYPIRAAAMFLGPGIRVAGAALRIDPACGVDVSGSALLEDADGMTASLTFGIEHHYRSAYEVWGSQGRIVLDRAFTPPADFVPVIRLERADGVEEIKVAAEDQVAAAVAAFARHVRAAQEKARRTPGTASKPDTQAEPPGFDAPEAVLRQAALVDAIRAAAREGAE